MTSFLKKLVEPRIRSKSPQKGRGSYHAIPGQSNHQHTTQSFTYNNKDYYGYPPPVCSIPLPPSPYPVTRDSSRQSNHLSNQSNESIGVHSWNTEKSDWRCEKEHRYRGGLDKEQFFLHSNDNMNGMIEREKNSRARSHSPRKDKKSHNENTSRSKSPMKRKHPTATINFLNSQCNLEGCSTNVVVQTTLFQVCRHQLCHTSEYFKNILTTHPRNQNVHVAVSGLSHPSPETQFRWFIESSIPCPALKDITDETLETCMRLSKRFQSNGLQLRCAKFILENACHRQPIVALCWLNWCLKHRFDPQIQHACLPNIARMSLVSLEEHRHMISERLFGDILAAKLRGCYHKSVHVFRTIHRMDHFSVEMDRCPRCGRTKEGIRVKVNADPCRKKIGCDRCNKEGCEIEAKAGEDLQAFYRCSHALLPLNDVTDDCHCQTANLAIHLASAHPANGSSRPMNNRHKRDKSVEKRLNDKAIREFD